MNEHSVFVFVKKLKIQDAIRQQFLNIIAKVVMFTGKSDGFCQYGGFIISVNPYNSESNITSGPACKLQPGLALLGSLNTVTMVTTW